MSIDQISLDGDGRGKWQEKEQKRRHGLADWFFRKVGLFLWTFWLGKGLY